MKNKLFFRKVLKCKQGLKTSDIFHWLKYGIYIIYTWVMGTLAWCRCVIVLTLLCHDNLQGVPKYCTHLFMTLYLLMDWDTETEFIIIPICVALKWVVNGLWRCWGTKVMVKTNSAIQIRKTHKVFRYRMNFNEWSKVNN